MALGAGDGERTRRNRRLAEHPLSRLCGTVTVDVRDPSRSKSYVPACTKDPATHVFTCSENPTGFVAYFAFEEEFDFAVAERGYGIQAFPDMTTAAPRNQRLTRPSVLAFHAALLLRPTFGVLLAGASSRYRSLGRFLGPPRFSMHRARFEKGNRDQVWETGSQRASIGSHRRRPFQSYQHFHRAAEQIILVLQRLLDGVWLTGGQLLRSALLCSSPY